MRHLALAAVLLSVPPAALAAGGHERIGCTGCHSMHAAKGDILFALPPNAKMLDPRTGKPHGKLSGLCLACHAETSEGGLGKAPVSRHLGHPYSLAAVNPRLARVPDELLRDGRFECVACHDPHPSNPNYRYLRIPVSKTPSFTQLCGVCHPRKADPSAGSAKLFSSMDEREARPPEAARPAARPVR